ncbi:iron-containing redox enzyme family protein [Streptacidiphilus sp. 4-A2]|nr:iron-containing redox enzyme family protein [Streptacidiphilus sp. 4-A2]
MSLSTEDRTPNIADALRVSGPQGLVEAFLPLLASGADEVDRRFSGAARAELVQAVEDLNGRCCPGDETSVYAQQFLLSRIYDLSMNHGGPGTAEGSAAVHEVCRLLERATAAAEDAQVTADQLAGMPEDPREFLSWLKTVAREHRAYKHPYYSEFISNQATEADLRSYVIQESVVDGRFDDLLAMMQVGTRGEAKMEIAANYWDEMGNGDPDQVHTHLFDTMLDVFGISDDELVAALTAEALLSGNLAVLLCRYRRYYPEAIGFLGLTEWFAPDRFVHVVKAWERLGLPDVGIVYHKLHITIDSQHAAGWFHNVLVPACENPETRAGIARGALWRLNSSARYLDERLARIAPK